MFPEEFEVMNDLPIYISVMEKDGKRIYFNKKWNNEYNTDEFDNLIHPEDLGKFKMFLYNSDNFKFRIKDKKGEYSYFVEEIISYKDVFIIASKKINLIEKEKISGLYHDLKTPINSLNGIINFLSASKNEQNQKILQMAKIAIYSEYMILDNAFIIIKNNNGVLKENQVTYNINELISELKEYGEKRSAARNIYWNIELMKEIKTDCNGDKERIRLMLLNLIDNAFKFTNQGGVNCIIDFEKNSNEMFCLFTLKDTGSGIDKSILEKFISNDNIDLFDERKFGLRSTFIITKLIMGKINFEPNSPSGTIVKLKFKIQNINEEISAEKIELNEDKIEIKNTIIHRILLVEDDHINRYLAKVVLRDNGFDVDEAVNGYEALDKFKENEYSLILLDIQMPGMDGISVMQEIRKMSKGEKIPILAVTAYSEEDKFQKYLSQGFSGFISKPYTHKLLLDMIHKQIFKK